MQRKKPASHRLWGRHPMYKDSWCLLATDVQSVLESEKRIRGMDERWSFKVLPISDGIPSDLEEKNEHEQ